MTLNTLWYALIVILFCGYFFFEGYDYGVGILLPFLGKSDADRRLLMNSIGPFWDANEVWLLTAGGAMFAAFPNWYATMFSGFYFALMVLLLALIGRGVAFEFRSKLENKKWRATWDWVIFAGSLLPPLLFGVALANLMKGVPIDGHMNFVGNFFDLISLYTVVGGLSTVAVFVLHGTLFLTLRTSGEMQLRARRVAVYSGLVATVLLFAFILLSYFYTDMFSKGIDPGAIPVLAGLSLISVRFFIAAKRDGWAFLMTALTIVFSTITVFMDLFPRVMVSSLNEAWSLTVYNAASNSYSLKVMTIVAFTLLPFILGYTIWSYWTFRKRLAPTDHMDY